MTDEQYMQLAIKEAQKAFASDEVPVGAVIVMNGQVIAKSQNQVELLNDSTAHAEILALTSAYSALGTKYLPDATIYITLEPCLMCAGALYWSKIGRIVWGAEDEKNGCLCNKPAFTKEGNNWPFHPKTATLGGLLKNECGNLLKEFFRQKR